MSSIAVGKTVGVAPEADLYYIGSTFGHWTGNGFVFDAAIVADCILRVCEMARSSPHRYGASPKGHRRSGRPGRQNSRGSAQTG